MEGTIFSYVLCLMILGLSLTMGDRDAGVVEWGMLWPL